MSLFTRIWHLLLFQLIVFGSKPIGFDSSEMSVSAADPTLSPSASSLSSVISTQQPQSPSSSGTNTETSQNQNKRWANGAGDPDTDTRIAKRARTAIDANTTNDSNDLDVDMNSDKTRESKASTVASSNVSSSVSLLSNPYALYLSANATRGRGHAHATPEPTTNSDYPISASNNSTVINMAEAHKITHNPYYFLTLPHTQSNPNPSPTANAGTPMRSLQSMYPMQYSYSSYPSYPYSHPYTYPYPPHHYPQMYPPYQYAYPYPNHVVHSPSQHLVPAPSYPVSTANVGAGIAEPGTIARVPGAVSAALPRAVIVSPLTTSAMASQACVPAPTSSSLSASDPARETSSDTGSNLNVSTSSKPSASHPNPNTKTNPHPTTTISREPHPKLKLKKSRKLGVINGFNAKPISIPLIPRDAHTHLPLLPLSVGIMTVFDLGKIISDGRQGFHNERYIFPVGYRVSRRFLSTISPTQTTIYKCTILDGIDGPKFQVIPGDNELAGTVISGTATGAWAGIVKEANRIRNRPHSNSVSGPDFFGLGQGVIRCLIQELEGAARVVRAGLIEGMGTRMSILPPPLPGVRAGAGAESSVGPFRAGAVEDAGSSLGTSGSSGVGSSTAGSGGPTPQSGGGGGSYIWQTYIEGGPLGGRHAAVVPLLPEDHHLILNNSGFGAKSKSKSMMNLNFGASMDSCSMMGSETVSGVVQDSALDSTMMATTTFPPIMTIAGIMETGKDGMGDEQRDGRGYHVPNRDRHEGEEEEQRHEGGDEDRGRVKESGVDEVEGSKKLDSGSEHLQDEVGEAAVDSHLSLDPRPGMLPVDSISIAACTGVQDQTEGQEETSESAPAPPSTTTLLLLPTT